MPQSAPGQSLNQKVRRFAASQGAELIGFAPPERYPQYVRELAGRVAGRRIRVEDYLLPSKDGVAFHDLYADPRNTLPSVRAVVILGVSAFDEAVDYNEAAAELRGKIARTYAYFPVVRAVAEALAAFLRQELGYEAVQCQNLPLKLAAARRGMGCYGENGLLLTREHGSFVALRAVLTSAPLLSDRLNWVDFCLHCGNCRRACPTGALYEPYKVDPSLCLNAVGRKSDPLTEPLSRSMGGWFRGCDICQEVCPLNRKLSPRSADPRAGYDSAHHSSHRFLDGCERLPRLLPLLAPSQPALIRRNAAIALGNIGRGRESVGRALRRYAEEERGELRQYFLWALENVERRF